MPSLTMAAGHDPVSGLSFRKVTEVNTTITNRSHFDKEKEPTQKINGVNVKGGICGGEANGNPTVDVLRIRLRKGRVAAHRNGGVYDARPGIPFYNNNGPLKAFPINNNTVSKGDTLTRGGNKSSLPNSESDLSSITTSSTESSPGDQIKTTISRPPLHRLNGRGHMKQTLPPGLTKSSVSADLGYERTVASPSPTDLTNFRSLPTTPLKSAMMKQEPRKRNVMLRGAKDSVSFAQVQLPPGMSDIFKHCFIPGTKATFQHETELPLLIGTDSSILRRRSSITLSKKNRLSSSPKPEKSKPAPRVAEDATSMVRSRSSASDIFLQPDMQILKACWNIILSFMGDDNNLLAKSQRSIGSIVSQKKKKLWRKSSGTLGSLKPTELSPANSAKAKNAGRPNSMFLSDASKKPVKSLPPPSPVRKYGSTTAGLTILQKVHLLVNAGLTVPFLQDEIYCLIMKQLVNNPLPYSTALGWILLALVAGCFAPSAKILGHVQTFLDHHQHAWGRYCAERLYRTLLNGPRTNPPSSLEVQAAKSTVLMTLPVMCMDTTQLMVPVDPATTSKEILDFMSSQSHVGDNFGYCVVLKAGDKIVNLGAGRFPIMDALSQVEMHFGKKFSKIDYGLYYRRDIFSPRDMFCIGIASDALTQTFPQICGGVKTGEYYCKQAPDLSLLIAHQYSIRFGVESVDEKRVAKFCEKCLPYDVYKTDKKNWCRVVTNTINALRRKQGPVVDPYDIMAQVVRYTMQNLSEHFVRVYSIFTFNKVDGVCTYTSDLSLTLSHEGVMVRQGDAIKVPNGVTESNDVRVPVTLLEIPATSLKKVELKTSSEKADNTLLISDIIGGSYEITSAHGLEIHAVLFRYIQDISTGSDKESHA